jgi:predicted transposase YdaD
LQWIDKARATIEPEERVLVMQLSPLYLEKIQAAERVGEERGEARGKAEGETGLILRQLNRRLGTLPEQFSTQIQQLTLPQLDELGEALLDFTSLADLAGWLSRD